MNAIGQWLLALVELTLMPDTEDPQRKFDTYAEMLAADFPATAFTRDSLRACAADFDWFPSYSDLRKRLQSRWNEHRPSSAPVAEQPGAENLSPIDRMWLDHYWKRLPEVTAATEQRQWRDYAQSPKGNLESLVRSRSPAAWRVIRGDEPRDRPADISGITASITQAFAAPKPPEEPPQPPRGPRPVPLRPSHLEVARKAARETLPQMPEPEVENAA